MLSDRAVSIVDDDEASRLAIASLVRSLGWSTNVFESAEQYLQWAHSAATDATACLISDVKMPGMSGVDLHEALLAQGCAPPTILVTAFPTDQLRAKVMANGALALLEKPIDVGALAHHLRVATGKP